MQNLIHFLKYNNLVPIVLGVLFLGSGAAFAATDPQAIYSQQQQVVAVDNTYIANKDLSAWSPKILITGVTEDADNYYVGYQFTTIDVVNYAWQDVVKNQTMTVSKADLGPRDLGLYVTGQLNNIVRNEVSYLGQVQDKARGGISQKTVATTYGGLIGKFLDTTTEVLPGYTPVVVPSIADIDPRGIAAAAGDAGTGTGSTPVSTQLPGETQGGNSTLLSLQVLGNNPAHLAVGSGYADLGVVLIDPTNPNIGYHAFVDGVPSDPPGIDTSTTSAHAIEYRATDQAGVLVVVRRIVLVGSAADPGGEVGIAGSVQTVPGAVPFDTTATSTPAAAPGTAQDTQATTTPSAPATTPAATTTPGTSTPAAATTPPVDITPAPATPPDTSASTTPPVDTAVAATTTATTTP